MNPDAATTVETIARASVADAATRRDERISAEVGHILFLDLVGYSRLSMEDQDRIARELRHVVRSTPEFQRAEVRGELICSDAGDGMALVFFRDPLAPVQCAVEIARAVNTRPHLAIRMGVHSGPITRVPDINGNDNVSGAGINVAQRVMDCGDGGHIILSSVAADMVRSFESYENSLTDLGEVTVKHGTKVHVFNLVMSDIGVETVPQKVRTDGAKFARNGVGTAHTPTPKMDAGVGGAKGERPPVGVGKTVSLVYKRRGAPTDERVGKMLETELMMCGFAVKVERQQTLGAAWEAEVREQFGASDAVVFLLSAASCMSEMFDYEAKLAGEVVAAGTGLKPKLLTVRVGYEEDLTDCLHAAFVEQYAPLWNTDSDDETLVQHVLGAFEQTPKPKLDHTKREKAGGAVPLHSEYYVVRPTDDEFTQAIARQDSIVLVKGGRQMGKTSLLARGVAEARNTGAKVVITDFQSLSAPDLVSADALYRALAEKIADDLDLDVLPGDVWNEKRSANMNLERYLRKEVLGAIGDDVPMVWGLDEVDRLFTCDFGSEVFGLFRSWHNKRSLDPSGPWSRLTLAIAYATEAHLFITDMNQSPFNVGTRLTLSDFTPGQVAEINSRYGTPLSPAEVATFHDLVGGQPYLTRRGLDELTASDLTFGQFAEEAGRDEGVYGDHLRRMFLSLSQEPILVDAVRHLLAGKPCPSAEVFYRLRTAGLVHGEGVGDVQIRCRVYQEYLSRHLV